MDYKNAYNNALERAKELSIDGYLDAIAIDEIFPELAESEDERIRKWCISHFKECFRVTKDNVEYQEYLNNKVIPWLENQKKQEQNKPSIWKHWSGNGIAGNGEGMPIYLIKVGYTYSLSSCLSFECDYIVLSELDKLMREKQSEPTKINPSEFDSQLNRLFRQFESLPKEELVSSLSFYLNVVQNDGAYKDEEKQSEQKSADKVEPKFKVGDWITNDRYTRYIVGINSKRYQFKNGTVQYCDDVDKKYHLWTIQDAKDGDVLSYVTDEGDLWLMIYQSLYEPYDGHVHYHALLINDNFTSQGTCVISIDELKPAAKEQRDLLFQKMKEAGYEWNDEKKELKLLITNGGDFEPAWSEEDEEMLSEIIADVRFAQDRNPQSQMNQIIFEEEVNWLKSLKQRIGE